MYCRFQKIQWITAEPNILFTYGGLFMTILLQSALVYQKVCNDVYSNDIRVDCQSLRDTPWAEDVVQQKSIDWDITINICQIIPAMVGGLLLGSWSDKNGRCLVFLIGAASAAIYTVAVTLLAGYPHTPLWLMPATAAITGIFGVQVASEIGILSYMADCSVTDNAMTYRMTIFNCLLTLSSACVSGVASLLTPYVSVATLACMATFLHCCSFFYALIRIPQEVPMVTKLRIMEASDEQVERKEKLRLALEQSIKMEEEERNYFVRVVILLKDAFRVFLKERIQRKRFILINLALVFFALFIFIFTIQGDLLANYVFRRPLSWNLQQLSTFRTVYSFGAAASSLIVITVVKKFLQWRDSVLVLIGLTSAFSFCVVLSFASSTIWMYVAVSVGICSSFAIPCLKSWACQLVYPHETGRVMTIFAIFIDLGNIASTSALAALYRATVSIFAPTVFILLAAIQVLCFAAALYSHILNKRIPKNT